METVSLKQSQHMFLCSLSLHCPGDGQKGDHEDTHWSLDVFARENRAVLHNAHR